MERNTAREVEGFALRTADGTAEGDGADPEVALWRQFAESATTHGFCRSWLALQCRMLKGVRCAMVLLGNPDKGPFTPTAVWPDAGIDMSHLIGAAERALRERRGLLLESDFPPDTAEAVPRSYHVAYPIEVSGKLHGVVVLESDSHPAQEIQQVMRRLHWGASWLEVLIRRSEERKAVEANERLQKILDLVTSSLEYTEFQQAAMAFVTRMATGFECDRVSLGLVKRGKFSLKVLSHSAHFDRERNLVRAIESAAEEAIDQGAVVVYPMPSDSPPLLTIEHEKLSRNHHSGAILTIPLEDNGVILGAITLERPLEKPFDPALIEVCKAAALMVGPILEVKQREERLLIGRIFESLGIQARRLLGPGYLTRKLVLLSLLAVAIFFTLFKIDYRVTATTSIEGMIQRVVAAPFNGYIKEALVRPGDVVRQGQPLCRLDDRDLKLQQLKWLTEKEQQTKQFYLAMAKHERPQIRISSSKMEQAEAQLELVEEQLGRTKVAAPFDGVVMSGDLSQSLGAPVERGQVLFEIAPLDAYRLIAQVDERDIGWIALGQRGELLLPSMPGEAFPFYVEKITPVSTAKEGRNYFRVEGKMGGSADRLRPGMAGVGKITIDRRRLIWVWAHYAVDWLRLKTWAWMP